MNAVKQKLNHYLKYMSDNDALLLYEWVNQNLDISNKSADWVDIVEIESEENDADGNKKTIVLPKNVSEYLNHIVKCIKGALPVSAIYLFGSYATGNYRENSDLDIYIVTPDKSKTVLELRREASRSVGFPKTMAIDFLVGYEDDFERLSKQLNFVENEVLEFGRLLYAKKEYME